MSTKQGGKKFFGLKRYSNAGLVSKQFKFESDKKLIKPHEKKVTKKHLSNLDALQASITKVYEREISLDYCCKLIDSMLCYMQKVIKNKSNLIKY